MRMNATLDTMSDIEVRPTCILMSDVTYAFCAGVRGGVILYAETRYLVVWTSTITSEVDGIEYIEEVE